MRRMLISRYLILPVVFCLAAQAAQEPPRDLLRGPEVASSSRAAGLPMVGSRSQRRAIQRQAVPVRRWLLEFGKLPLSASQRDAFRELTATFSAEVTAFKERHGSDLNRVRRELKRIEQRQATADDSPSAETVERGRALQSSIRRLEAKSPKPEALQMACWQLLDSAQQDLMRSELKVIRDELRAERATKESRGEGGAMEREQSGSMQSEGMQDGMQQGMSSQPQPDPQDS